MGMRLVRSSAEPRTSAMTRAHFAGAEFGDGGGIGAVFVAEGQIVKEIFDGEDVFPGEHLCYCAGPRL